MSEFFTWELLASYAGASLATLIITQFLKGAVTKLPTQILSYLVAIVILFIATAALGGLNDWTIFAIIPFNAILISMAANGEYSALTRKKGGD